ncbi:hypothetical protein OUZ56_023247 [Daphnia magna]|uniref:Uncharacterized protein n=1 Tax=Daphnia magna TaxID=35525 RepID=A0ABR0AYS1_9CRUS|nr:hypothetical protein OUZ56_023247 [Daphnia magna]
MAAWRRRALELGSGCMCDLMWPCMWEAPLSVENNTFIPEDGFEFIYAYCQLEGFLFFTELYHFHGMLADCQLASLEWYGPYQQCYDLLLKYTDPSENILIEIMEISALHAELHNDG